MLQIVFALFSFRNLQLKGPSALIEGPSNLAEGGGKIAKGASGKRGLVKVSVFHAFAQKHPMKSLKIAR